MPTLARPELERLLRDLPPAPAVLPRLMALLADDEADGGDVLALVRLDPALAAAILRASRSAMYGARGQRVENLEDAVAEIGFKEVYRLTSFFAVAALSREDLPAYELTPETFWKKSVACALAMETLCGEAGGSGASGYTVGLLHAVGEILVDRLLRRRGTGFYLAPVAGAQPLPEQEKLVTGYSQTELAGMVMRHWQFPEALIEPIEFQFEPDQAPAHAEMATRLKVAKWLCHLVLRDEETARAINPDFHFAISVPGNTFARMVEELQVRLDDAARCLRGTGCIAG